MRTRCLFNYLNLNFFFLFLQIFRVLQARITKEVLVFFFKLAFRSSQEIEEMKKEGTMR